MPISVFDFQMAVEAFRLLQSAKHVGKAERDIFSVPRIFFSRFIFFFSCFFFSRFILWPFAIPLQHVFLLSTFLCPSFLS